ncbi:MAG: prephenate dehydrogenase [Oscillospiraceae bacterium]|nr:prephenate dehydrogenase [Oscillospiraceae bacterium]
MTIAVIGLGLIGGSICKALKKYTDYSCLGLNRSESVIKSALADKSIDRAIDYNTLEGVEDADLTVICFYPDQIVEFAAKNIDKFKKGSIVIDAGGIKTDICEKLQPIFKDTDVTFIGSHPMAGREYSGYAYSQAELFQNASFIVTPYPDTPEDKIKIIEDFARKIGFGKFVVTNPHEHDRIIAYTSQLAHIVSNAYVKSDTIKSRVGFSAGSFLDLTRVAKLNEDMWSTLMMSNRKFLADELGNIINKLSEYLTALKTGDEQYLHSLLKDGRIIKEDSEKK